MEVSLQMKKLVLILFVALLAFPLIANGTTESAAPMQLTFGSASAGGNFYLIGAGLSNVINNLFPGKYIVTSTETGGGSANVKLIQTGDIDFGITMSSSIADGLNGKLIEGVPTDKVRGFLPIYPSLFTAYALESTGIKTLQDFNGKTVGFGSRGGAPYAIFMDLFPKMGIQVGTVFTDSHNATAAAISNGQIDAAFCFSLPPFPAISEIEATKSVNFIALTEEEQKIICEAYPFYKPAVMPAGSYKGVTEDYATVSDWFLTIVSADLSEDIVYEITKALFENNEALLSIYAGLAYVQPENCLVFNCPLHPGVIKYLEEVGVSVPASLRP